MRFIQVLLMAMLVMAPVAENSFARGQGEGRTVAAEKSKKAKGKKSSKANAKKAKSKKAAKAKNGAKANKKAVKKSAKTKSKKTKKDGGKKAKNVARAKKSHAPAEIFPEDAADPSANFEISPEMQDDLPEPNTGNLTE